MDAGRERREWQGDLCLCDIGVSYRSLLDQLVPGWISGVLS